MVNTPQFPLQPSPQRVLARYSYGMQLMQPHPALSAPQPLTLLITY